MAEGPNNCRCEGMDSSRKANLTCVGFIVRQVRAASVSGGWRREAALKISERLLV